jgi:carbonic anhydrase
MNNENQRIKQYKKIRRMAEGLDHFQDKVYPARKNFFQKLAAAKQEPVLTLITCSDSRIETHELLGNRPGEIFMVRNVGNIVDQDAYGAIEYSIKALGVRLVFVMGHQQCGAMKAILHPETLNELPNTKKCVELAHRAKAAAAKNHYTLSDEERLTFVLRENVVEQVLRVKAFVAALGFRSEGAAAQSVEDLNGLGDNDVRVVGIVYNIGKGTVDVCKDTDSENPVWENFNAKTFLHRTNGFTQLLKQVTATIGKKIQQLYQALLSK